MASRRLDVERLGDIAFAGQNENPRMYSKTVQRIGQWLFNVLDTSSFLVIGPIAIGLNLIDVSLVHVRIVSRCEIFRWFDDVFLAMVGLLLGVFLRMAWSDVRIGQSSGVHVADLPRGIAVDDVRIVSSTDEQ